MNKWIAEFDLEDGDTMPEHMDLQYMGAFIDFHCRPMWIPCSERLPDKHGVYLVTGKNGHVFEYDYSDFTTHNEKWSYCENEIVAWMPLPEPYKEEGDEK